MATKIRLIADEETQRQALLKSYRMGPIRFILIRGLLKWALTMFVFFTAYEYFVNGYHDAITVSGMKHTALICLVAGLGFGIAMWFVIERKVGLLRPDQKR
jgi:hypothetical protein